MTPSSPAPSGYTREYLRQYEDGDFETAMVELRRREVLKTLERLPHQHILEIGCALEPIYPYVEQFESCVIVEPSVEMARVVASAAVAAPSVEVLPATIQEAAAALRDRNFDLIVISSVLHEVDDPLTFLSAVRSLCNRRTVCYLNVPNALSFHRLLAVEMGLIARAKDLSQRDRRFGHHGVFDRASLRSLLEEAGFTVVRDGSFFVKPFTHDQMHRILEEEIVPRSLIEGLYGLSKHFPEHGCELFAEAMATP